MQHNHHLLQLDRHLYAVRHRPAPASSKLYVLQHALIPRLTYTSQFIPPTPKQLEILDKRILKWSRQILRLTPTFPAAVLASPHMINIPMPSDAIHTSQLRCFWRSQIRGPRQANTTTRLLQRALRHQATLTNQLPNITTTTTKPPPCTANSLWAHHLIKLYADEDLALSQHHMDAHSQDPRLPHQHPETQQAAAQLHSHAIHTVGDLHTGKHWIPSEHLPATLRPYLQAILAQPNQPAPPRPIHPGQTWHVSPAPPEYAPRTIFEILHSQNPQGYYHVRPWRPVNPHSHTQPLQGDQYQWTPHPPPQHHHRTPPQRI
jgi:hypothetical protein